MPKHVRVLFLFVTATLFVALGGELVYAQSAAQGAANDVRAACAQDVQKLCANVPAGGGRILACLKEHQDQVSDGCKQAVAKAMGQTNGGAGGAPAPASAPAPSPAPAPNAPSSPAPSSGSSAPAKPSAAAPKGVPGKSVSAAKEKFTERIISDAQHGNMRAVTLLVPEKWRFDSKLEWHYNWTEYPCSYSSHAENPDNAEAYFQYPLLALADVEVAPQWRQYVKNNAYKPGERMPLGSIYSPPQPPLQAMAWFIKTVRPNVTNLKWIGQQDLPDLAKALGMAPLPNDHGIAIKIGYDLNGQPVEEAFFGVYYLSKGGNDAVTVGQIHMNAGAIQQVNWGFRAMQSFRAPAGTLEKRMPVFCLIAKSLFVDPKWGRLAKAINDQLLADFQQKLKQGWDQLRAANAIMEQTMRQQAAFQKQFDTWEENFRKDKGIDDSFLRTGTGNAENDSYLRDGGKRSAADHMSDLIRGVDTLDDPENGGGTKQLSNLGQYHFTDGFGSYRTYDDPNMTPEKAGEVGSWKQMTEAP